jgi:uncharacterized Fe-S radical SAM superfamily protein PflX
MSAPSAYPGSTTGEAPCPVDPLPQRQKEMAMHSYIPGYLRARQTGRLKQAVQEALDMLSSCTLCPRQCRVDRTRDET